MSINLDDPSPSPVEKEQEPDWDSFESYDGPEKPPVPRWVEGIFHLLMLAIMAALIFAVSGALITLLSYRTGIGRDFAVHETREQFIGKFIGGGVLGWIIAIYYYFRKMPSR